MTYINGAGSATGPLISENIFDSDYYNMLGQANNKNNLALL